MYKGRFEKSGGRSTADILRERASESPLAAPERPAPQFPQQPAPAKDPDLNFSLDLGPASNAAPARPQAPANAPEPDVKSYPIRKPAAPQAAPQAPRQVPPRPVPVRPQAPAGRPVPPRPGQVPAGMPQRPGPRPPMPRAPGTAQGPGGMPIRPGYHQNPGGRPPVPPRPGMAPMPGTAGRPPYQPGPGKAAAPRMPQPAQDNVRRNSVVFYSCYFGFIFLFFVITFFGLNWLKGWLTDYEAAQPYTMADAIFQQNFVDPNWKIIYQNSTSYQTNPEDCDAYVELMEEKVGNSQLTYQETSAGLSGDKKYFIKLGDERIASFTLVGDSRYITDIPDWTLGEIELLIDHDNSYRIQMMEGHTAFVNDKPLDESYTIMKASTMAQSFLPVGTKGVRIWTQQVDNLMGKPKVRIQDDKGKEMEVVYDVESQTFTEKTEANTITPEQEEAVIGAAKVYGRYMIAQAGRGELAKYFDSSSKIYSSIRDSEKIVQQSFFSSYDFGTPEITDFCMYTDDLFSARISISLNVTRTDGTVKPFPIDTTLFFSQHSTGKWLAYDMTNEDVQKPIGQVRLTFNSTDGTQIASDFYDTDATELDTPMITVPEGKVFSGWVRENVSAEGKKVLEVVFTPDETGHVVLTGNSVLEPMVLKPLFENAPTEGGTQ